MDPEKFCHVGKTLTPRTVVLCWSHRPWFDGRRASMLRTHRHAVMQSVSSEHLAITEDVTKCFQHRLTIVTC